MKFVSYGGVTFASLNVSVGLPNDTPDRDRQPVQQSRVGAPALITGIAGGSRTIPVYAMVKPSFDTEGTILALLAALDADNKDPRALVAQLNDGVTNVQIQAWVGSYVLRPEDKKGVLVTFYTDDDRWTNTAASTDGPTDFAAAGSRTFTVAGQGRVKPTLKLSWKVARPGSSATMGWTFMRRITVTNNDVENLHNHPFQIGPLNTSALSALGKIRTDCADLVVFDDKGERLKHGIAGNANGTNNRATFLWFVIDELPAGTSRLYYVAYGNPNASASSNAGFAATFSGSPSIDTTAIDGQQFGAGTSTTVPTNQTLDPNQCVNSTLIITGDATGVTSYGGQFRRVSSHTNGVNSTLTVSRAFSTTPDTNAGYVVVGCGFKGDGGQASATAAGSLTDSAQAWGADEWTNAIVEIITLDIKVGVVVQTATVTGNNATQLFVASWPGGTPASNAIYRVYARNGSWIWRVDQTRRTHTSHRGRWRFNNNGLVRPTAEWMAIESPGAWTLTTYNPKGANNEFSQQRWSSVDTGGGNIDYFAILDAAYQRSGNGPLRGKGFANGVRIHVPCAIGIKHDYALKNPDGAFRAVFGFADRLGEDWGLYKEDSTPHASLTTTSVASYDLTQYGTVRHLLAALTSADDADIDKTENGVGQLVDNTVLQVILDPSKIVATDIQNAPEEPIYDFSATIRRSASATETGGDDVVDIGGDGRHVFLRADQRLWVGPVGDLPYVARIYSDVDTDPDASDFMTDTGGTTLQAHTPTGGGSWTKHAASGAGDATIDNNRVHNANSSTMHLYYHSQVPTNADYTVQCAVVMRSDNDLSTAGPAGRIDTAANTCYWLRYDTNGNTWRLEKVVAGVVTSLGTFAQILTVDQEYTATLSMHGTKIVGLVDGFPVVYAVDSAISAAGRGGVRMFEAATSTVGVHLDVWSLRQGYLGGYPTYVRDLVNQVQVRHVEADFTGTVQRIVAADALPLQPGSQTFYVSDDDGSQGTISVEVAYTPSYL